MIEDIRNPLGAVFVPFWQPLGNSAVDTTPAKLKIDIAQLLA